MKLGFTEVKSNAQKKFGGKDTLNFTGGGAFGLFTSFEFQTLKQIIIEKFKLKHLVIYEPRND
jgi:exopolysaccharide biosynthesis predicted pyruvyltransferase EpsI